MYLENIKVKWNKLGVQPPVQSYGRNAVGPGGWVTLSLKKERLSRYN